MFDLATAKPVDGFDLSTAKPVESQPMTAGQVATSAISNIPKDFGNVVGGVYQAVRHPLDTAKGVLDLGAGALQNALPEGLVNYINSLDPNQRAALEAQKKASAVGQQLSNDYGTWEGLKHRIAEHPVGTMMDASSLLTGGGGLVSKVPYLSKAGDAAILAGKAIDPLSLAVNATARAVPYVGSMVANIEGGIGTHTGGETIKQAARAGAEGGQKAETFLQNLRGASTGEDILSQAKSALDNIRKERSSEYLKGMHDIGKNQTILDFSPVEKAYQSAKNIGTYKGQTLNKSAVGIQDQMGEILNEWKQLDPAEYHTAEGFDALKKAIGDVRDNTQYGTPARVSADRVYNAVKEQINKQDPHYAFVMKDYETASKLVKEIEQSLSLGNKGAADTAIRKLQSLSRNNANTNYGHRLSLAKELENHGAPDLLSDISGQALSSWQPRGLGGLAATGTALGGLVTLNPYTIPLLMAQSPRIAGEASYYTGKAYGMGKRGLQNTNALLNRVGIDPTIAANYLYQSNDLPTR